MQEPRVSVDMSRQDIVAQGLATAYIALPLLHGSWTSQAVTFTIAQSLLLSSSHHTKNSLR